MKIARNDAGTRAWFPTALGKKRGLGASADSAFQLLRDLGYELSERDVGSRLHPPGFQASIDHDTHGIYEAALPDLEDHFRDFVHSALGLLRTTASGEDVPTGRLRELAAERRQQDLCLRDEQRCSKSQTG